MNSQRLYYILLGTIGLLTVGLLGGAYGATTLLQNESKTLLEARTKTQSLDAQQAKLAKAKADIAKYENLGRIAKSIVPQDKDQAQTVREIVKIANNAGVKLGAITFPTSTLGSKVPSATGAAGGAGASSTGAAPATPAPAGGAAGGGSAVAISQLKPVAGISGVYDLAITVQSDASSPAPYNKFINFLAGLENNRRTALVSGITITPDTKNPDSISFTLDIDEYIKP